MPLLRFLLLLASLVLGCKHATSEPGHDAAIDAPTDAAPRTLFTGLDISSVSYDCDNVSVRYRFASNVTGQQAMVLAHARKGGSFQEVATDAPSRIDASAFVDRDATLVLSAKELRKGGACDGSALELLRLSAVGTDVRFATVPVLFDWGAQNRAKAARTSYEKLRPKLSSALAGIGKSESDVAQPQYVGTKAWDEPEHGVAKRVLDLLKTPLDAPLTLTDGASAMLSARGSLRALLSAASTQLGEAPPSFEDAAFVLDDEHPFAAALARAHEEAGAPLDEDARAKLLEAEHVLGAPLSAAMGRLVSATSFAVAALADAHATLDPIKGRKDVETRLRSIPAGARLQGSLLSLAQETKSTRYLEAAARLGKAIDAVHAALAVDRPSPDGLLLEHDAPFGRIVIAGVSDDVHEGPAAIVLDLGGNDRYPGPAASTLGSPSGVAVVIDAAGNDTYGGLDADGSCAAGVYGVAMLVDLEGDDRYATSQLGQGAAIFGVGLLWDGGGKDAYTAKSFAQGSAMDGVGLLVDLGGDDLYESAYASQAYGGGLGLGAIVEGQGNDLYRIVRLDSTIEPEYRDKWAADGSPGHGYLSFSQGYGGGIRLGGSSDQGGGLGLLFDGEGDDQYLGVDEFGLAGGYYFGVGAVVDLDGNDLYESWDYTMGSAAHQAGGFLLDAAGNDRYRGARDHAQGHGLDMSAGFLIDLGGDDLYSSKSESQGVAVKPRAFGVLVDAAGNDVYESSTADDQGWARDPDVPTLPPPVACFLDLGGGKDTYSRSGAGDGLVWHNGIGTSVGIDE